MYQNNVASGCLWGVDRVTRFNSGQSSTLRGGLRGGRPVVHGTNDHMNSGMVQNHTNLIDLTGLSVVTNIDQPRASDPPGNNSLGNVGSSAIHTSGSLKADKKTEYLSSPDEIVTFIVGAGVGQKTFKIHKQFACEASSVLKKALEGGFEEAQTQTYTLDDVDPAVFRHLAQYLYRQRISFDVYNTDLEEFAVDTNTEAYSQMCQKHDMILVKLWVLADRLLIPKLQNQVMDEIQLIWNISGRLHEDCYQVVYDNTSQYSPLRHLIATQCCWGITSRSELLGISQSLGRDLLLDIAVEFLEKCPERVRTKRQDSLKFRDYFYVDMN